MDAKDTFTRSTLIVIWTVALLAFLVWGLLAWGGHALLSDSGTWLAAQVEPWIASAAWEQRLASLLVWSEHAGTFALWAVWAFGSVGLLLTCAFATMLFVRANRALASAR